MSKSDNSLYIQNESYSPIVIIMYVDDLVIGGKELAEINKVKSSLSSRFKMKDMHELHYSWHQSNSEANSDTDLSMALRSQLTLQVWNDHVQTCVYSSLL